MKSVPSVLRGGAAGSNYSNMEVTVLSNQTPGTIGLNFGLLPQGTIMSFRRRYAQPGGS